MNANTAHMHSQPKSIISSSDILKKTTQRSNDTLGSSQAEQCMASFSSSLTRPLFMQDVSHC